MNGDRVTGIRGRVLNGATVMEKTGIVVGADGMRSMVARAVQAPIYRSKPARTCVYFAYWSGVPLEGCEIYVREQRVFFAFPTNDDLICIAIEWPLQEFQTFRAGLEGNFLWTIAQAPSLAERVQAGLSWLLRSSALFSERMSEVARTGGEKIEWKVDPLHSGQICLSRSPVLRHG